MIRFRRSRALVGGAALLLGAGVLTTTRYAQAAPPVAEAPQDAGYAPLNPARLLDTRVGGNTIDGQQAGGGPIAAGALRSLPMVGRGGVPATGVAAVAVNVTVTGTAGGGFLTVWPGGTAQPNASTLNYDTGDTIANFTIVKVGASGDINLSPSLAATNVLVDVLGWVPTAGSPIATFTPTRVRDTRNGTSTIDGAEVGGGAVAANATIDVKITGRGPIPASAEAAIVNITATGNSGGGFVTAWPTGTTAPNASTLNYGAGQTIANGAIIKLGTGGKISLRPSVSATNLIVDVVGVISTSTTVVPLTPTRLLDSRPGGQTIDGIAAGFGIVAANGSIDLQITSRGGIPSTGVGAVIANLTVTGPTAAGFASGWPTGTTQPNASSLNFKSGQTIANGTILKLGPGGRITLSPSLASSHLILDVVGWIGDGVAPPTSTTTTTTTTTSTTSTSSTTVPQPTGAAKLLAAGYEHACVIMGGATDGTVRCWGSNDNFQTYGQDLTNSALFSSAAVVVSGVSGATKISLGNQHSCVLATAAAVTCWGRYAEGQTGAGSSGAPHTISGGWGVTAIDVGGGYNTTCVLSGNGSVWCMGDDHEGQLGNHSHTTGNPRPVVGSQPAVPYFSATPLQVERLISTGPDVYGPLTGITKFTVGGNHACGINGATFEVWCWGDNSQGELGVATTGLETDIRDYAVKVGSIPVGVEVTQVVSDGNAHSCAMLGNGTVYCWGKNAAGQLGNGTYANSSSPVLVSGLTNARFLSTGAVHTCVALSDGGSTARCWGRNDAGQLGIGVRNPNGPALPAQPFYETLLRCTAGSTADGCENGGGVSAPTAVKAASTSVGNLGGIRDLAGGRYFTCALVTNGAATGAVRCFGRNNAGQLGDLQNTPVNATSYSTTPVGVQGLT